MSESMKILNVESSFEDVRDMYLAALLREYEKGVERGYFGKTWRPKAGMAMRDYVPMSFSGSLLHLTGGLAGLEAMWELDPNG